MMIRRWIWFMLMIFIITLYCIFFIPNTDPLLDDLQKQLQVLHPKLKGIRLYSDSKSHTIDKKHVFICVKDSNGNYYDKNMLVYVICHEYAHVLSKSIIPEDAPHNEEFNQHFHMLLTRASQLGLYDFNKPLEDNYCGLVIN